MIVVEGAYHGHTGLLIDLSPYKFRPGGRENLTLVHVVPIPDTYRRKGEDYIEELKMVVNETDAIAGFIVESMLSCAGQVPLPGDYLSSAFKHVREAGGLCIADEVQVGLDDWGLICGHLKIKESCRT